MKLMIRPAAALSSREVIHFSRKARQRGRPELRPRTQVDYAPPAPEALALRALREELGLEPPVAAHALGITRAQLQELEEGRAIPATDDGWQLAGDALRKADADLQRRRNADRW